MKIKELKFSDILAYGGAIHQHAHLIRGLVERAKDERTIRSALPELREWNMHTDFLLLEAHRIVLIKEWKDMFTQMSDMQATVQSLSSLAFVDAFEGEIQRWSRNSQRYTNFYCH
jgi:hypothetical protein